MLGRLMHIEIQIWASWISSIYLFNLFKVHTQKRTYTFSLSIAIFEMLANSRDRIPMRCGNPDKLTQSTIGPDSTRSTLPHRVFHSEAGRLYIVLGALTTHVQYSSLQHHTHSISSKCTSRSRKLQNISKIRKLAFFARRWNTGPAKTMAWHHRNDHESRCTYK